MLFFKSLLSIHHDSLLILLECKLCTDKYIFCSLNVSNKLHLNDEVCCKISDLRI